MGLKYAIIGCGRISSSHISAALKNNLNIIAICDLEELKMEATINNFKLLGNIKKYINYKQMLKQAKQKQEYKSYIKQQRTQKIGHAYNTAKGTAQITKQASSNLFNKVKQLYNKRKRVGYQKQY